MVERLIYASGPISILDYIGATGWYREAEELLGENLRLIRPMRAKDFLRHGHDLRAAGKMTSNAFERALVDPRGITARDRFDVQRCDAVLMNLLPTREAPSLGCMIELGWADAWRKPVVVVMDEDSPYAGHPMVEQLAAYVVPTLKDGCDLINALFYDD